ncbi:MAG: phage integrase SAM-like domain-containing protein [Bacteroidetes bacterium]|nr:phage integrase SAM-like domain-containing protein [Bacteroidota bacterium]
MLIFWFREEDWDLKNSQTCLSHITSFIHSKGKGDLLFSEITIEIVTDFETYLLNKSIAPNTTKKVCFRNWKNFILQLNPEFLPTTNPFILFENKKLPVENRFFKKGMLKQF